MNSLFTCTAAATFLALAFACFVASLSTSVDVKKDSVKLEEVNPRLTFWADRVSFSETKKRKKLLCEFFNTNACANIFMYTVVESKNTLA